MWKLLLVGINYLASLLDTWIFRSGWLSDQDAILHMLVGCEPENQELENQHWTSSNPHRFWQCLKQIMPCWHGRLSEEIYWGKDSAWHQLIDSLFSRCCVSGIGFHLLCWKFILKKKNVSVMSIDKLLHVNGNACSARLSASEMFPFERNKKILYLWSNQTAKSQS